MALDAGFVAAVLEGIEGTLDEVIERVDNAELKASLDVLQTGDGASGFDRAAGARAGRQRRIRRAGPRRSGIGCHVCFYPRAFCP